jgi:inhibitor of KinA sporulation pathway (predicted exonuclease)
MRYIIVDLEATCWKENQTPERMEIIEIGAVSLQSSAALFDREFQSFVRPLIEPKLSDFCCNLTKITQVEIDNASFFPVVFKEFVSWIGDDCFTLCSWGNFDLEQLRLECRRHGILFPKKLGLYINLKGEYSRVFGQSRCGLMSAMRQRGLQPIGIHHRGIDDARNIARLANLILPKVEAGL